jgi:hypothetical protein
MDAATPTEPGVEITVPWLATQLVPSPEIAVGTDSARGADGLAHPAQARFGMRWQVTPLLFSWGIHRGLSPWRFFVVEPNVRNSGSIELFVAPEYVWYGSTFADGWITRGGVRAYFPLVEHGEYLSTSLGASEFAFGGKSGAAYEAGLYALFGTVGLQVTVSPSVAPIATIATLRLRYF